MGSPPYLLPARREADPVRIAFSCFDASSKGHISKKEFVAAMRVGKAITKESAEEAFRALDADCRGFVDFQK